MEQIYYTQCPMGYGLGASNGFQVKRLSASYPVAGDFRHLGLRAFLAGSRTLAPPTLRYRRDGRVAEVAWLTPRPQEYETERGLWGRPGGHFAHGLRLEHGELAALANWPAGLYDAPFWRRADPEPTRGRLPEPLGWSVDLMSTPPTFAAVAPLAAGADVDLLARLLVALATVTRQGRTLFLIGDASDLPRRIALLTFAFPRAMRAGLTFSTYHDRPEELPGFRLQGTLPAARPNRVALTGLGIVADLIAGTVEPRVEPANWARTLAGWLNRAGRDEESAWAKTDARSARLRPPAKEEEIWSDEWLDRLVGFHEGCRVPAAVPLSDVGWERLAAATRWATAVGLADEWLVRGPSWWREAAGAAGLSEARAALVAHGSSREAWGGSRSQAVAWGEVFGLWFGGAESTERLDGLVGFLRGASAAGRLPFLTAALKTLPADASRDTLDRLRAGRLIDPALLLPLEVRGAVAAADAGDRAPLRDLLGRALDAPGVLGTVLDVLGSEADESPERVGRVASLLGDALERSEPSSTDFVRAWALPRDDAEAWLGPHLRRLFATPDDIETWRSLRDLTPEPLRPMLALVTLDVTRGEGLPPGAFRWAVEELLLGLDESRRPYDPSWPDAYLERLPSGLDLIRRLFARDQRQPELRRWLAAARKRGDLSAANQERLVRCQGYAQALKEGDSARLIHLPLPEVPPADRGPLLSQLLSHLGRDPRGFELCLDACRHAWPGAFVAGAPGLAGLARPIADALDAERADASAWLARLMAILAHVGADAGPHGGLEHNGLAAEVVGAMLGGGDEPAAWRLRQWLFRRGDAWRILAVDAALALRASDRRHGTAALRHWDAHLDKGAESARFFELMLNACDGPTLATAVGEEWVLQNLRTIGALPWWDWSAHVDARDDLRDGFARLAPLAPLREDTLLLLRSWMADRGHAPPPPAAVEVESLDLELLEGGPSSRHPTARPKPGALSVYGGFRWRCLDALTTLGRSGLDPSGRWSLLRGWEADPPPIDHLPLDERYRVLAWVILQLDPSESAEPQRLASWFFKRGVSDPARVRGWADEIADTLAVPEGVRLARVELVGQLADEFGALGRDRRAPRAGETATRAD